MCLGELGVVCPLEGLNILFKCVALNACSNLREEEVHCMVVVELEEGPCEHFLCGEEVVDVGSMMFLACIALASFH